jgi:hypothetical protein
MIFFRFIRADSNEIHVINICNLCDKVHYDLTKGLDGETRDTPRRRYRRQHFFLRPRTTCLACLTACEYRYVMKHWESDI